MKRKMAMQEMGERIKHTILVLSGKGGVGKSTVATGLAVSFAQAGAKVGLLDIDITGPNVPKMMGLTGQRLHVESGRIHPAVGHQGVKVISMAFLLEDEDTPVVAARSDQARGHSAIHRGRGMGRPRLSHHRLPPGTSDEPLTVAQSLPDIDGMVVVTTPQEVALLDSRKAVRFADSLNLDVLGVIENMSGYTLRGRALDGDRQPLPSTNLEILGPGGRTHHISTDEEGRWSVELDVFKIGGGEMTAKELDVPFLGRLPFDPGFVRGGDDGVHRIVSEPEGASSKAFLLRSSTPSQNDLSQVRRTRD